MCFNMLVFVSLARLTVKLYNCIFQNDVSL